MSLTKIADADKHLHGHHHDATPMHADHSHDGKQAGLHDHHKHHKEKPKTEVVSPVYLFVQHTNRALTSNHV